MLCILFALRGVPHSYTGVRSAGPFGQGVGADVVFFFSLLSYCPQFWITLLARPFGGSKTLYLYSG